MSPSIPLDKAELLGILLEGILYGFSLLMFGGTIWRLLSRRFSQNLNRNLLTVACFLLLLSTLHVIIGIIRIMQALILYRTTYPGGPVGFLSDVTQWTFLSQEYLYVIQSLLADAVILYRCYMVWRSKLVMAIPILLWCSAAVCGFGSVILTPQYEFFTGYIARWITAFYSTTLTTNLLSTGLLAWGIWRIDQRALRSRTHKASLGRQIVRVVVDAGVIYNLTLLAGWICFARRSYGQIVVQSMIVPIISITFYIVIIWVGIAGGSTSQASQAIRSTTSTRDSFCTGGRNRMEVHITTLTENKVDPCHPLPDFESKNRPRSDVKLDDADGAV